MTELEKITYAKTFIDQLANGINPLDGTPVPGSEVINQVRVTRCLFYVSGLLQQMIDCGGIPDGSDSQKTGRHRKTEFSLTEDARAQLCLSEIPLTVSETAKYLNNTADGDTVKRISAAAINRWLIAEGLLEEFELDGKNRKRPTPVGNSIGIFAEERSGQYGPYTVVLFSADAQKLIFDNLEAIVEYNVNLRNEKLKNRETQPTGLQGSPWTEEQEMILIDLFQKGSDLETMAKVLQRTKTGIRARLVRLGLINNRKDI